MNFIPSSFSSSCSSSLILIVFMILLINPIESKLFKTCQSPHGTISSIEVSGCTDKDSICKLIRGEDARMNITFTPNKEAHSAKVNIVGEVGKVPFPFIVNPDEACGNYGLKCPLIPGKESHFSLGLPIRPVYPSLAVTININLIDETNNKLACVRFKARITDKLDK